MRYFAKLISKLKRADLIDKQLQHCRNVGIIAHIDSGKTTTTERMLYYSGMINRIGEVDRGDTVMDYLPEERERGITITSAAITFRWNEHRINLIDTPGHVDFTMEVERSLRVLDGAICILDAVAGVQAQTLTVWKQADRNQLPRLIFVNKMDREGSDFHASVSSVKNWLKVIPIVCQVPFFNGRKFVGIVDLVRRQILKFEGYDGSNVSCEDWSWDERGFEKTREEMIESIADLDEEFLELFVAGNVTVQDTVCAIRRICSSTKGVPVFCGAAFKNIGVQPLLDAIIDYLPTPAERPMPNIVNNKMIGIRDNHCVALAFKVIFDPRNGMLVYVRVYSGSLKVGDILTNTTRNITEKITKLYLVYADTTEELPVLTVGQIGMIMGLKETCTGDTLTNNPLKPILSGIPTPTPVVMMSISTRNKKLLEQSLINLQREDPSCHVQTNVETGQTIISGMGRLHLEILADRLLNGFKVDAVFSEPRISYRECSRNTSVQVVHEIDRNDFSGNQLKMNVGLRLESIASDVNGFYQDVPIDSMDPRIVIPGNVVREAIGNEEMRKPLDQKHQKILRQSLELVLQRGPILGFGLLGVKLTITQLSISNCASIDSAIRLGVAECARVALFPQCDASFMEPMMLLDIKIPLKYRGSVISDLNSRRAEIRCIEDSIDQDFDYNSISAIMPLSECLDYANCLRSVTQGTGSFDMELQGYSMVSPQVHDNLMEQFFGKL